MHLKLSLSLCVCVPVCFSKQSLCQVLDASVNMGSRVLETQLEALLFALHQQVYFKCISLLLCMVINWYHWLCSVLMRNKWLEELCLSISVWCENYLWYWKHKSVNEWTGLILANCSPVLLFLVDESNDSNCYWGHTFSHPCDSADTWPDACVLQNFTSTMWVMA